MNKIYSKNTLTFLGDISLNDKYNELYQNGEKPFEDVKDILFSSDFVVGNLECLAKGDKGENLLKKPRLKTNLETLNYLKDLNLGLALLAHNHIYDNLEDGFLRTIKFLDENNIAHIGAGLSPEAAAQPFIKDFHGTKISILNYVTHDTNPNLPYDAEINLNFYNKNRIIEDIKRLKPKCDFVFLLLHWGVDNSFFPTPWQQQDAKEFVNHGVDCIIGHHPHTLQGYEKIGNSFVFYSLGNFCFSPFYINGQEYGLNKSRQSHSVILHMLINGKLDFQFTPIQNKSGKIVIGNSKIIQRFYIISNRINLISRFWALYSFYLNVLYKLYFYFWGDGRNPIQRLKLINKKKIKRLFSILCTRRKE